MEEKSENLHLNSSFVIVPDPVKKDSIAKTSKNQISFILLLKFQFKSCDMYENNKSYLLLELGSKDVEYFILYASTSSWHHPFMHSLRLIDFMRQLRHHHHHCGKSKIRSWGEAQDKGPH